MKRENLTKKVLEATESLEGEIKNLDRDSGWKYHETLYKALDALEQATEYLTEDKGR